VDYVFVNTTQSDCSASMNLLYSKHNNDRFCEGSLPVYDTLTCVGGSRIRSMKINTFRDACTQLPVNIYINTVIGFLKDINNTFSDTSVLCNDSVTCL